MEPICWEKVSLTLIKDAWVRAGLGQGPLPWSYPLALGNNTARAMLVMTADYRVWQLLSYREFYRMMVRDENLKLVFENGHELPIIEAFVPAEPRVQQALTERLFTSFRKPEAPILPPNVIPFKKT